MDQIGWKEMTITLGMKLESKFCNCRKNNPINLYPSCTKLYDHMGNWQATYWDWLYRKGKRKYPELIMEDYLLYGIGVQE